VDEELGFDKMKVVASIKDPSIRSEAAASFKEGKTPPQVRQTIKEFRSPPEPTVGRLEAQKRRLEKHIVELREKLESVEHQLMELTMEESQ
jgi:TolA-binding protein